MRLSEKTAFQGFAKVGIQMNPNVRLDILSSVLWRDKDDFLFWNGARDASNRAVSPLVALPPQAALTTTGRISLA